LAGKAARALEDVDRIAPRLVTGNHDTVKGSRERQASGRTDRTFRFSCSFGKNGKIIDTKALIADESSLLHAPEKQRFWWSLIQKRAFVLVTVYSDADRTGLYEIRDLPSVSQVDLVLGAFDAVVTVEAEDEKAIEVTVANISKTRGVKEAKPLIEIQAGPQGNLKPVIGAAPAAARRGRPSPTT
jgi:hypothetical protein